MAAGLTLIFVAYVGLLSGAVCWRYLGRYTWVEHHETRIYWVLASGLIGFTALRPFGAGLDDGVHYIQHYRDTCPVTECQNWLRAGRDFVWYLAIAVLKSVWETPAVILWLSAVCLLIKLVVIWQLSQHLLLALLIYVSVFYQAHDMTTFRQSMAVLFYLLAFWSLVRCRIVGSLSFLILSGLTHKQAVIAPLLLMAPWFSRHQSMILPVILTCTLLILLGLYPHSGTGMLPSWDVLPMGLSKFLLTYIHPSDSGWLGLNLRGIPLEIYPLTLGLVYLIKTCDSGCGPVWSAAVAGICLAYLVLWFSAGAEVVQYRLFYFFLLPLVFVMGCGALRKFTVPIALFIATVFIVKYDVLHSLFLDSAKIHFTIEGNGTIENGASVWVPCGQNCRDYGVDTRVRFVAVPAEGHRFAGWSGECSGDDTWCSLIMDGNGEVSAHFVPVAALTVVKSGEGMVAALGGMTCGSDCEQRVDGGQVLVEAGPTTTLKALPASGARFAGWSGACHGVQPTCHLTMDQDYFVRAIFVPLDGPSGKGNLR
jgi:hypothetical protein